MKFNLEKFKEYINTYEPRVLSPKSIIKDIIYGIGLSIDENLYEGPSGFQRFLSYIKLL